MRLLEILSAITVLFLLGWSSAAFAEENKTEDVVMIASITPDTFTSGKELEASINLVYRLMSHESGAIRITANILVPNDDHMIASTAVKRGMGEITLKAKFVPRYWSDVVSFGVNAALLIPAGKDLRTKALSVDRVNLHVNPHDSNNSLPAVSSTYVDGIKIVSVTPDSFKEGVNQDIIVRVSYELLSREQGEISLSINGDRPATRTLIASTRVEIGKGEAEIRANFAARKIAGLPVGRLLITLSEFPRGRRSRPLAWDENTIGVD